MSFQVKDYSLACLISIASGSLYNYQQSLIQQFIPQWGDSPIHINKFTQSWALHWTGNNHKSLGTVSTTLNENRQEGEEVCLSLHVSLASCLMILTYFWRFLLVWGPLEADLETKTWMEMVNVKNNSKKYQQEKGSESGRNRQPIKSELLNQL